jgi:hypothetical protein
MEEQTSPLNKCVQFCAKYVVTLLSVVMFLVEAQVHRIRGRSELAQHPSKAMGSSCQKAWETFRQWEQRDLKTFAQERDVWNAWKMSGVQRPINTVKEGSHHLKLTPEYDGAREPRIPNVLGDLLDW